MISLITLKKRVVFGGTYGKETVRGMREQMLTQEQTGLRSKSADGGDSSGVGYKGISTQCIECSEDH